MPSKQVALKKVLDALGDQYEQRRFESVGPAVSSETAHDRLYFRGRRLLAIVAYVWFRFEWQFALGAIVALTHDVLLTVGIFSLLQMEFDLSIVAALADNSRLFGERHRGGLGSYREKPAEIQTHGSQRTPESVHQRDAVAHHSDRLHGHRRIDRALYLRRRGDPQLQLSPCCSASSSAPIRRSSSPRPCSDTWV